MLQFKTILNIHKKAIKSIRLDSDNEKIDSFGAKLGYVLAFVALPLIIGGLSFCHRIMLTNIQTFIATSIAIFTGLSFTLLLNIGSKIRSEYNNENKDDSFIRYKNNMEQIAHITFYVIMHGIIILILILVNVLAKMDCIPLIELSLTSLTLILLTRFFVSLFFLLQRFYHAITDEIENIL